MCIRDRKKPGVFGVSPPSLAPGIVPGVPSRTKRGALLELDALGGGIGDLDRVGGVTAVASIVRASARASVEIASSPASSLRSRRAMRVPRGRRRSPSPRLCDAPSRAARARTDADKTARAFARRCDPARARRRLRRARVADVADARAKQSAHCMSISVCPHRQTVR